MHAGSEVGGGAAGDGLDGAADEVEVEVGGKVGRGVAVLEQKARIGQRRRCIKLYCCKCSCV